MLCDLDVRLWLPEAGVEKLKRWAGQEWKVRGCRRRLFCSKGDDCCCCFQPGGEVVSPLRGFLA